MTEIQNPSLEDVLTLLLESYDAPSYQALTDFAKRYPVYRNELMDFVASWSEEVHLPPADAPDETQEARTLARAQSFLQNQLFERGSAANPSAEMQQPQARAHPSLSDLARASGRTLLDVARAAGLDLPLVTKLNNRRFRPDTICKKVGRSIADFLGIDVDQVIASWTGPPRVGAMSFMAQTKPVVPPQEDFKEAVSASSLSPPEKAALLGEE
jgi:hypothetical protein